MTGRRTLAVVLTTPVVLALVLLGRLTVDADEARARGYDEGEAAGYLSGLAAGRAEGIRNGRAYEATLSLPPRARSAARAAFTAGYVSGANDAFGDFDGGWYLGRPYVIAVARGRGGITYRIERRTPMHPGVDYFVCPRPSGSCERARR